MVLLEVNLLAHILYAAEEAAENKLLKFHNILLFSFEVDVLETQYSILLEKINSTRDFETLRLAHDHFITTLQAQPFLLMRQV